MNLVCSAYEDNIDYIKLPSVDHLFCVRPFSGIGNTYDPNTESENANQMEQNNNVSLSDFQNVKVGDASNLNEQSNTTHGGSDETSGARAQVMNEKRRFDELDGSDHDNKRARMDL